MKNKKLVYVLVPLALLVWGLIFYRIFTGMENKGPDIPSFLNNNQKKEKSEPSDSIRLMADYRDPFLSGSFKAIRTEVNSSSLNDRRSLSNTQIPALPDVQYYGIISNAKSKNKVGLLKVKGKSYLLKEGEAATEVRIIRLFKDSIIVAHQNYKHTIKRT